MRKLALLLLLAMLASPAFCVSVVSHGPEEQNVVAQAAPATGVIWIAMGNQPVAVNTIAVAEPEPTMWVCYFGNSARVPMKIARRLIRSGAKPGRCDGRDNDCDGIKGDTAGDCDDTDSRVNRRVSTVQPPAETEKAIQIERAAK